MILKKIIRIEWKTLKKLKKKFQIFMHFWLDKNAKNIFYKYIKPLKVK